MSQIDFTGRVAIVTGAGGGLGRLHALALAERGAKVVVIEDMVSTGMSSLSAVRALREAGAEVLGMVAIFTYGFDLAAFRFDEAGVPLTTLSNYGALVEEALATGSIQPHAYEVLREWRRNPDTYDRDNQ